MQTVPAGRLPFGARLAAGVTVLIVGLAILQPWGATQPPRVQRGDEARAAGLAGAGGDSGSGPSATPTARPTAGPGEIECPPSGWQLVSIDRLGTWTVRSWDPATPVLSDRPLDPAIEEIRLEAATVLAVGGCAPSSAPAASDPRGIRASVVAVWQRTAGGLAPLDVEPFGPVPTDPGFALLYRPVALVASPAQGAKWPPGRFVVELALPGEPDPTPGDAVAPSGAGQGWFIGILVPGA